MKSETIEQIKRSFGARATDLPFECGFYSRDMAPVPALLVDPLFNTRPDVVVRPGDVTETADLLKTAWKERIPVTPRAGASTVYFNTVPAKGGMVLDLNLLTGVEAIDERAMTVTVAAGMTWLELDGYLNALGFAVKSFPSSAPAASIGGWFSMMGYGIGSIKYGSLLSHVRQIEVVLPNGEVSRLTKESRPPLAWFAASEGTLGIITKIELEIRRLNPMKYFLMVFPGVREMGQAVETILRSSVVPYNLHFADDRYAAAMQSLGFSPVDSGSGYTLAVDYEGSPAELAAAQEIVNNLLAGDRKIRLCSSDEAEREWEERFSALRLKRGGPSVLGGEIWLPVGTLPAYLADIKNMAVLYDVDLISYGHVVTPERATVMTLFHTDETKELKYVLDLALVKKIHDVGRRHGGSPYGVGLWNTPYLSRIFSKKQLAELRKRKEQLDNRGIMNPGKLYRAPLLLNPVSFAAGMEIFALMRRITGRRGCR